MQKIYFTLSLLVVLAANGYAQTWEPHPAGYSEPVTVFDVEVVDENTIWTSSYKGDFSGLGWSMVPSNLMSKSTDGGQTWMEITVPVPGSDWGISNISALDDQTAWISLHSFSGSGAVYKTTDGGATWTDMMANMSFTDLVHFWNADMGVAVGDPIGGYFEIYTTSDGGDSWTRVPAANIPDPASFEYGSFAAFDVVGSHIWFGTTSGRIYHSADYGQTWTVANTSIMFKSYTAVEGITFRDSLHGIGHSAEYNSVPFQSTVVYTEDGGASWIELPLADSDFSIFEAQYVPGSPYLVKTSRGSNGQGPFLTSISMDDGVTWMDVEAGTPIMHFEFLSPDFGWGGKFKNADEPAMMYRYMGDPLSGILSRRPLDAEMAAFPNPTTGQFRFDVELPNTSDLLLLVNDANGKLISREVFENTAGISQQMDLKGLPNGTYTVTVSTPEGNRAIKVVKQ